MRQRRKHGESRQEAAALTCPRAQGAQGNDAMCEADSTRLRRRRSGQQLLLVLAAVLAAGAEARDEVQSTSHVTSCPATAASERSNDAREQVAEWNAWTTSRCGANYAAAVSGGGGDLELPDDKKTSVVCAYYDPASFADAAQRQSLHQICRSKTSYSSAGLLTGTHACYDNGECLVEFMNVAPVAASDTWEFRLGELTAVSGTTTESSSEQVRVGELVVSARVSKLIFDGRRSLSQDKSATPVRFATDLSSASSLTSLLFIGLDVSASPLPSFPASLRELHIVDCLLHALPMSAITQLPHLGELVLSGNVRNQNAPVELLTEAQFEFLRARLVDNAVKDGRQATSCPTGASSKQLGSLNVCVAGVGSDVTAVQRRMLLTNSTSNLRTQNHTSSSSSDNGDSDSTSTSKIYFIVAFAGPALFALYKLVLYVYFFTTYSKHQRSVHVPVANRTEQPVKDVDDSEDRRPTEKDSSTGSGDSLMFAMPPTSIVLPPAPADQRRFNNMSFWVDEELQDWRMDFNQVKMLKCLTTTPNQKRHMPRSTAAAPLCGCEVWLGKFYPQGAPDAEQTVVLKWLPPNLKETQSPVGYDKFKGEIKRQARFSHPNVVKFFGIVWSMDTHLVAVTEYMARGDLRQWLHRYATHESGRWTIQKVQILLDVAKALLYLHSMRPTLVHGNCNSRNVLLSERMKAKLSDFGSAKDVLSERELMAYSAVGSGRWISPEALVGRESKANGALGAQAAGDAAAAADVYSLGILMSEMDTHELPFSDLMQANRVALPETDVLQLIARGALSPTLSPTCHPGIGKLIEGCTAFSPKHRPSSRTVVQSLQEIIQELRDEAADGQSDSDDDRNAHLLAQSKGVVV